MPDAAWDSPVCIFAREFFGIRTGIRVRSSISIPFEGDGGHADDRTLGKPHFQIVIFRLALGKTEPPAVVMNDDGDVVRIIEGGRASIKGGIGEVPFRRSELPNEFGKIVAVFIVAGAAAFGGKVILVPPEKLSPLVATESYPLPGYRSDSR